MHRNTLDPAIHQAVFHFLRGQNLVYSNFELEAIAAFDCVLQSLQMINWNNPVGNPRRSRADLVATLGLDEKDGLLADYMYFLRNEFAAHAGGWRWWDVGEYVDGELMKELSDLTLLALQHAADTEPTVRRVNPGADIWSIWLMDCFPLLFGAIWFPVGR